MLIHRVYTAVCFESAIEKLEIIQLLHGDSFNISTLINSLKNLSTQQDKPSHHLTIRNFSKLIEPDVGVEINPKVVNTRFRGVELRDIDKEIRQKRAELTLRNRLLDAYRLKSRQNENAINFKKQTLELDNLVNEINKYKDLIAEETEVNKQLNKYYDTYIEKLKGKEKLENESYKLVEDMDYRLENLKINRAAKLKSWTFLKNKYDVFLNIVKGSND
jgi:hypothetical protein